MQGDGSAASIHEKCPCFDILKQGLFRVLFVLSVFDQFHPKA
jgi:hypothetical protein